MTSSRNWIATYHKPKGYVTPLELDPADIHIEDIQHALSNICRFGGHCREFYSVAQHSVHVADWLARNGHDCDVQMMGLLHDASEAYLGDVVSPIKHDGEFQWYYQNFEYDVQRKIYNKLLPAKPQVKAWDRRDAWWIDPMIVRTLKEADEDLLVSEAIQLFNIQPDDWNLYNPLDYFHIKPISPRDAKLLFEDTYHQLRVAMEEA